MAQGESAEKTEEPTGKRIADARKKGNVPNSKDTSALISLFISFSAIYLFAPYITNRLKSIYEYFIGMIKEEFTASLVINMGIYSLSELVAIVIPIAMIILIAGVLGTVFQIGILLTLEPLKMDLKKINPIQGIKKLFGAKIFVDAIKMVFKSFSTFIIAFVVFFNFLEELPEVTMWDYFYQILWLKDKLIILVSIILAIFLFFAIIDFSYTRYKHKKDLKMSKQEVKDEMKNMDGNPEIKARIRRKQMELSRQRMMSNVQDADVVITNPTHYAIAIRYDQSRDDAPMVLAKGVDRLAQKIKELARENEIMIYEDKELARALYKDVEIDRPIPKALYEAVAKVLAFVFESNKNQRR
jgi:flagellar biosynthetic protein FlhB